jgi:hypothetical protein
MVVVIRLFKGEGGWDHFVGFWGEGVFEFLGGFEDHYPLCWGGDRKLGLQWEIIAAIAIGSPGDNLEGAKAIDVEWFSTPNEVDHSLYDCTVDGFGLIDPNVEGVCNDFVEIVVLEDKFPPSHGHFRLRPPGSVGIFVRSRPWSSFVLDFLNEAPLFGLFCNL